MTRAFRFAPALLVPALLVPAAIPVRAEAKSEPLFFAAGTLALPVAGIFALGVLLAGPEVVSVEVDATRGTWLGR